jgi:putative protein-disulfide isomerase
MLHITYYTDPLCCWSWAFEPQWRRLLFEFRADISFQIKMGGLIPAWNAYHDTTNNVSRPIQMGPVWMHAAQLSGMPMNTRIWMEDPPASSYPSCIAVCTAGLQSQEAATGLLRLLRQAVMLDGINIALPDNLFRVAENYSQKSPDNLDLNRFINDFETGRGTTAFKLEMEEVKARNITRFPTLIIRSENGKAILITGYRTYADLVAALKNLNPDLSKTAGNSQTNDYSNMWPDALPRETAEVLGTSAIN